MIPKSDSYVHARRTHDHDDKTTIPVCPLRIPLPLPGEAVRRTAEELYRGSTHILKKETCWSERLERDRGVGQRQEVVSERRDRSLGTNEDADTRERAKLGEMRSGRREIQGCPRRPWLP